MDLAMQTLPIPAEGLLESAPLNSWVALSADQTRIVAVGDDPQTVFDRATELGEEHFVLAKTPPTWGALIL